MQMLIYLDQTDFTSAHDHESLVLDLLEYGLDLAQFYSAFTTAIAMLMRTNGNASHLPSVFSHSLRIELSYATLNSRPYRKFIELIKLLKPQWQYITHLVISGDFTLCFHKYNQRDILIQAFRLGSLSKLT